ncbi:DUF502 domain-containing protein [Pararhodospirillum oryzae]|uniref:Membrane protein n=1 Tax=Pararhodospirillum oryzae TaxID=478448 RepID=A0A512HAD4_9PROT|nr:DUF502 domain-containing protein [Pararhodospirillum oryzae]GEO82402.1 membrane protein [Pararhodospirillum oryzae]
MINDKGESEISGDGRHRKHMTLTARLRAYFLAGILVTTPISVTLFVAWTLMQAIDRGVIGLLPEAYRFTLPVPGIGLLLLMATLTFVGAFTAGYIGRLMVRMGEYIVGQVPVIRNIYGVLKQIVETVLAQQSAAFRQVVLVEYPRKGIWALAFITGVTEGEVQNLTEDETINVFLPTTPNPTSGFLLFVPRRDLVVLDMSVEDGIKMVISGGIFTPPDRRPPEVRATPVFPSVTPRSDDGDR